MHSLHALPTTDPLLLPTTDPLLPLCCTVHVLQGKRWFHCGKTKEKDEGPEDAEAGTEQWQEGKGKDSSSAKDVERCHHRMQVRALPCLYAWSAEALQLLPLWPRP